MTSESRYSLDLNQYVLHTIKARMLTNKLVNILAK